jgi:outer membrane lipase/esterase
MKSQNLIAGALTSAIVWLRQTKAHHTQVKAATILMALMMLFIPPASASTFDAYFGFGDSTIDSGWWAGALNGQCGSVSAPCTTGNPTKDAKISAAIANGGTGAPVGVGLMSSQILAADIGATALPANQTNGTNYAISGALSASVAGFGNLNLNANLPSTVTQITNYLLTHTVDANAVYEVSSGGNDRTYANSNFSNLADKETFLTGQASALAGAIQALAMAGAKTILVRGAPASTTLASFWTNTLFSDLSALNVNFIQVDMAGLVQTVESNPTAYGFTASTVLPGVAGEINPSSACVAGAGASGWGQWCANTITPDPNHEYSRLRSLDGEMTSFYSDDEHFSAAGQAIVANYELGLLNPTPLPAALPLFALGLGAFGLLGWRRKRKRVLIAH